MRSYGIENKGKTAGKEAAPAWWFEMRGQRGGVGSIS